MNPTNTSITRGDIAEVLKGVGEPGVDQDKKRTAVETLFQERGESLTNSQGHSILDELSSWGEF